MLLGFLYFSCSSDSTISKIVLETFHIPFNGQIPDNGSQNYEILNPLGGLMILGSAGNGSIDYYIDKIINAQSQSEALAAADSITLHTELDAYTLSLELTAPANSSYYEYSGLLSISPYFSSNCIVEYAAGGIYISDMAGTILINNGLKEIEIERHNGSCNVQTVNGNLDIDISLSASDQCRAVTSIGDIQLTLPVNTSATLSALTGSGSITVINLDMAFTINLSDEISGTIGDGEALINLETTEGNIIIIGIGLAPSVFTRAWP